MNRCQASDAEGEDLLNEPDACKWKDLSFKAKSTFYRRTEMYIHKYKQIQIQNQI